MSSNCKHTVPCGCEDTPLTSGTPCASGTPECPTPDPCPETFCAGCVVYCGDSIADIGIDQGDRMDVILQRLALFLTNPGCITPVNTGAVTLITVTTVGLGYTPGAYINVPLLSGSGASATADITVDGTGTITIVALNAGGTDYTEGDILVPNPASMGASTPTVIAGFTVSIAACMSVLGVHSTLVTSTSIKVEWLAELSAVNYQVEYKAVTSSIWLTNPLLSPTTTPNDIVAGLTADTAYNIRVNNICNSGNCYSVTLLVTTKS
jgi:hypothetical protein